MGQPASRASVPERVERTGQREQALILTGRGQQLTKKDELLAQAQNTQGIASVAPDSVANLAGGGIVAFSGEDGRSDVREPSRGLNEAYRRTGTLLPETSGYEGMGPIDFIRRIFGEGVSAASRADEKLKRRLMQSALPAYNVDPLTSDLPSTANSRSPTPSEAAPAAVAPPARGAGGGGGGRAAASAPAAAAPAAAQEFNASKYFLPIGNAPDLGPVTATNPYEKPKSTEEYINEHKALLKKFGVEENPYAEREAALRAKQAAAGDERSRADAWNLVQTGAQILGTPGHWSRGVGTGIAAGAARKVASDEKFEALKDKRDEALAAIKVAQNEIKIGHVKTGIEQLNTATKNYNDAQGRIEDMTARRQEQQAQLAGQVYGTQTIAETARGQAAVQAELEIKKLAQQLQISEAQLKAEYAKIGAMRASGGPRTPAEIQLVERLIKDPEFARGYEKYMSIKKPEDPLKSMIAGTVGPQGYDPSKVKPLGK